VSDEFFFVSKNVGQSFYNFAVSALPIVLDW